MCSFSSVFVNIILPYRLTLKGCSYKSASFQRTNHLFVFCGLRTPQPMWLYTRHIFGARDSPTCANYALQRTTMDNQAMFPDAASAVLEKFYMDDYLDSFEDPDVAFKMSQELITLLALGGFRLTKFISNVTKINKELNPPQSAPQQESKNIVTCGDNSSHVLGLKWDHIDDTLVVSVVNMVPLQTKNMRRIIPTSYNIPTSYPHKLPRYLSKHDPIGRNCAISRKLP